MSFNALSALARNRWNNLQECYNMQSDFFIMPHQRVMPNSHTMLATHSIASYLINSKACSWTMGHFFLSGNTTFPPKNCMVHNTAQVMKSVTLSATLVDLGALYKMQGKSPHATNVNQTETPPTTNIN